MTRTTVSADIEDLFCQGQPFDTVVGAGDWSRDDVLTVLREHAWDLDPSGRLPRSKRITSPPGLRRAGVEANAAAAAAVAKPVRSAPVPARLREELPPAIVEPAPQPPADVYEAIADWADDGEVEAPVDRPPVEAPTKKATVAVIGPEADAAVARFLAERTVPAGDEQSLTGPELREGYEDWFGSAGAPVLSVRQFGAALTARYRKKQSSTRNADGVKPMRYYGLAWKPAVLDTETPTEGTAPGTIGADAAGTAPELSGSGHGIAGPDAQPQVSPSRSHAEEGGELGASDAPAELTAALTAAEIRARVDAMAPRVLEDGSINSRFVAIESTLRARHGHPSYIADLDGPGRFRPGAIIPDPAMDAFVRELAGLPAEASDPVEKTDTPPLNLLAVGLDHSDRRVRAAARAVERAVDVLCAALSRVSA